MGVRRGGCVFVKGFVKRRVKERKGSCCLRQRLAEQCSEQETLQGQSVMYRRDARRDVCGGTSAAACGAFPELTVLLVCEKYLRILQIQTTVDEIDG